MNPELQTAVTTLLLGVLAYAGKLGKAWYDAKMRSLEEQQIEADERTLQFSLQDCAREAHAMVERTFVKARKDSQTWDEPAKVEARARALMVAEQLVTSRVKRIAKERGVNLADRLTIYIEGVG